MLTENDNHSHLLNQVEEFVLTDEPDFHARECLHALKNIWQGRAKNKLSKIDILISKNIPKILQIDAIKLQHCLDNLVENAVKATKNGKIRISITKLSAKTQSDNKKDFLILSVQDTGCGLCPERISSLYDRNSRAKADGKMAYGVVDTGLPMTQCLIKELGGKIMVKSQLDVGSIFSLVLPFPQSTHDCTPTKTVNKKPTDTRFKHLNVLVVDDYNLNHLTVKALLQDNVSKIFTASNGYEALEILHSCPVDIVLMDIHMPGLDGVQTSLKIRESGQNWASIQIVAMTADPQYHHARLYKKIGMDGTLAKPFRKEDILRIFENAAVPVKP